MAGHHPSFMSYAMRRALPSLSSSQSLVESSEDSRKRVGKRVGIVRLHFGRRMRKHSYFQWTENRFTGSLMLRRLSIVIPIVALALEDLPKRVGIVRVVGRQIRKHSYFQWTEKRFTV